MSKHIKKKKRTPQKSRVKKSPIKLINLFIITLSVILLGVITNTFIDEEDTNETTHTIVNETIKNDSHQESISHEKFEEKTKALEIEYVDNTVAIEHIKPKDPIKPIFKYDETDIALEEDSKEEAQEISVFPPKKEKITISKESNKIIATTKPQLVIIIDDVSSAHQVKAIKDIGYPITMAFLPPTQGHKNSAKIAEDLKVYMVHLPLEASNKSFEEQDTLHIGDSLTTIEKRIKKIKQYYPNTTFLNNHTGSRFTSDYESMDKLFTILKKHNYIFVDSKTTAKSVTKKIAKKHNMPYISRNIFLDNKHEKTYIQNQLKKAVNIAKKTGLAIAIGHPHKVTIKTLKNSKHLLDGIDVIQIDKIKL